ncbi:hypothetical protein B0O99DRAFT_746740 [Bisporella sp. PMI_857]|nr:hypothetical protein B0O99DRAFT_746740 [Bisporella sp. PMI_857]
MVSRLAIISLTVVVMVNMISTASAVLSGAMMFNVELDLAAREVGFVERQLQCPNPSDTACTATICAGVCCTFGGKFLGGCALGNSCIISSAGTLEGCCPSYVKNFPLRIDAGGLAKMHMLTSRIFSRADVSTCNGPVAPCANANQPVVSPTIACPSATPSCVAISGIPACTGTFGDVLPPPTSLASGHPATSSLTSTSETPTRSTVPTSSPTSTPETPTTSTAPTSSASPTTSAAPTTSAVYTTSAAVLTPTSKPVSQTTTAIPSGNSTTASSTVVPFTGQSSKIVAGFMGTFITGAMLLAFALQHF